MPQGGDRTIGDLIDAGERWLVARGVEEARSQCIWLGAAILSIGRNEFELRLDRVAGDDFTNKLRDGVVRLGKKEPVQYVIGEWDFRMLTLKTDSRALIPRPETEELVQLVLDDEISMLEHPSFCDVGTGSGCIAVSLAVEHDGCTVIAIDREQAALSLARENAEKYEVTDRVGFVLGDCLAGAEPGTFDAIVSNPPYVTTPDWERLPPHIKSFEPRSALDGGADGLDVIRRLAREAAVALKKGGRIFLEIGDEQGDGVKAVLEGAGFSDISIIPDFAGKTRYAKGSIV